MKLNLTFTSSIFKEEPEYKVVVYGEKPSLLRLVDEVQKSYVAVNVFLTEDKKEEN